MSRSVGRLDEALRARLGPRAARGEAVLIATTDAAGRPHPALLSADQILAPSPVEVRFAVGGASRTARNLRERGAVTLCLLAADLAAYVKARASERAADGLPAGFVRFDARVEDVLLDEAGEDEHGARLSAGIAFTVGDEAAWSAGVAAVRGALEADGREPRR